MHYFDPRYGQVTPQSLGKTLGALSVHFSDLPHGQVTYLDGIKRRVIRTVEKRLHTSFSSESKQGASTKLTFANGVSVFFHPAGFQKSQVRGARCVILHNVLSDMSIPEKDRLAILLKSAGSLEKGGQLVVANFFTPWVFSRRVLDGHLSPRQGMAPDRKSASLNAFQKFVNLVTGGWVSFRRRFPDYEPYNPIGWMLYRYAGLVFDPKMMRLGPYVAYYRKNA